ncbi:MAG TPA: hypothetical protein PLH39_11170, partial [Promineifilum sp.]|nr:hypothetical protein [Promineifilum sp.]
MSSKAARVRRAVIAILSLLGVTLIIVAAAVELLGLDLTPGFGVLQTLAFLVGVTALTIAVYLWMNTSRPADTPRSLQADIGLRLSLTGLVFCY